jgi:phosphatidylglycerol lysyltransferase
MQLSTAMTLLVLAVCILVLVGFTWRTHFLTDSAWWEIVLSSDKPLPLRLTVALAVALGLFAIWSLIRPGQVMAQPWDAGSTRLFAALGGTPPAEADGLVWSETNRAAIPFRRCGRILLGLGDPAGEPGDRVAAVWRLRDLAVQEGRDPAFWRAGPDLLGVYADLGLTAFPLDNDGLPLAAANGDTPMAEAYLVCQAEVDLATLLPLLPSLPKPGQVAR